MDGVAVIDLNWHRQELADLQRRKDGVAQADQDYQEWCLKAGIRIDTEEGDLDESD